GFKWPIGHVLVQRNDGSNLGGLGKKVTAIEAQRTSQYSFHYGNHFRVSRHPHEKRIVQMDAKGVAHTWRGRARFIERVLLGDVVHLSLNNIGEFRLFSGAMR